MPPYTVDWKSMGFKNLYFQVILRVIILTASIFLFVDLFYKDSYLFTKFLVFMVVAFQVYYLFYYLNRSNREVIGFLKTIKYDDFTHSYPEHRTGSSLDELFKGFNDVMRKFREIRAEKEAQYQYLKTIVQHVGIGIITFDREGEIQIMNAAARKLLGVRQIKNVNQLKSVSNELITALKDLRTGGRDLVKISREGDDEIQLAVYAIELSLRGKEFKLISIQNIQSELEEKEMEAWQNLIRVLTHEIMNSVTPISSLAGTVEGELNDFLESGENVNKISNDTIEDFHMALHTIRKRSDSLIKFVSDFRNMTKVRHPELAETQACDILQHILALMKRDIEEREIQLIFEVEPKDMTLFIDAEQIEQVILNLVKNAIEALEENEDTDKEKILKIRAWKNPTGEAFIAIEDNGPGIEEEAQKKIFIPFFTTKKHGSGIGLSLSKQIMRHHKGNITVKSVMNAGTEFLLRFSG